MRAALMPRREDVRLDAEIRDHLESLAQDHMRAGLGADEARAAARRDFGAVDQMKEHYRDRRGLPLLDTLRQDLRFGWRLLTRAPGFTSAAVTMFALGIGAT